MVKTRIAVLISGNGTNLQALIDAQKDGTRGSGDIIWRGGGSGCHSQVMNMRWGVSAS